MSEKFSENQFFHTFSVWMFAKYARGASGIRRLEGADSTLNLPLFSILLLIAPQALALDQTSQVQVLVGTINPKIACSSNSAESYALYLPSGFSISRKWP